MYHRPNIAPQALRKGRAPHLILIDDTKHIAKNQSVNIWATTLRGECYVEASVPVYWIYIPKFYLALQKCIIWKACIAPWKVQSVLRTQKCIHQLTSIYSICMLGTKNKNISMPQPLLMREGTMKWGWECKCYRWGPGERCGRSPWGGGRCREDLGRGGVTDGWFGKALLNWFFHSA